MKNDRYTFHICRKEQDPQTIDSQLDPYQLFCCDELSVTNEQCRLKTDVSLSAVVGRQRDGIYTLRKHLLGQSISVESVITYRFVGMAR